MGARLADAGGGAAGGAWVGGTGVGGTCVGGGCVGGTWVGGTSVAGTAVGGAWVGGIWVGGTDVGGTDVGGTGVGGTAVGSGASVASAGGVCVGVAVGSSSAAGGRLSDVSKPVNGTVLPRSAAGWLSVAASVLRRPPASRPPVMVSVPPVTKAIAIFVGLMTRLLASAGPADVSPRRPRPCGLLPSALRVSAAHP
jgi:hypothetical protein